MTYVGITAITKIQQVQFAKQVYPTGSPRQLMLGISASHKSILGLEMPVRERERSAYMHMLPALIQPGALNWIHYHIEAELAERRLLGDLRSLHEYAENSPHLHGFQLNVDNVNPHSLEMYRNLHGDAVHLVISVNAAMMKTVRETSTTVPKYLDRYKYLATHVLLDLSGGKGTALDFDESYKILSDIASADLGFKLSVAGGLGPDRLGPVIELAKRIPSLGFDAESNLRDKENRLDFKKVSSYLQQAQQVPI